MTARRWLSSILVLTSCSAPQPVVWRPLFTATTTVSATAPTAPPPAVSHRPITLLTPPLAKPTAAAFSATSDAVVVRVGGTPEPMAWSLATGEPKPLSEVGPVVWPTLRGPQIVGNTSTTIDLGAQSIDAVTKAAKELGSSVTVEGRIATVSTKRGEIGSDRSRFLWLSREDGSVTVLRLDVGSKGQYRPWTKGMSGLGTRTGGAIDLDFSPDVERAIVTSSSQTGATYAFADSRLVDTRTWRELAVMPAGVQGDWYWSPSGAYVGRLVWPSFELAVSDGKTGKLLHVGEGGVPIGYSSDESLTVLAGEAGGGWIERTATGERVFRLPGTPEPPIVDLLFSSDGKALVVVRSTRVDVWNLETGGVTLVDTHRKIDHAEVDPALSFVAAGEHVVRFDPPALEVMSAQAKALLERPKLSSQRLPKLARAHETFEVESVIARPHHDELLVVGCRGREVVVMGDRGVENAGGSLVIVDATKKIVHRVDDPSIPCGSAWAFTEDGEHIVGGDPTGLAGFTPALAPDPAFAFGAGAQPNANPPRVAISPPLDRWIRSFPMLDSFREASKILLTDAGDPRAIRALRPQRDLLARQEGSDVILRDTLGGKTMRLRCLEAATHRGCLVVTEDRRYDVLGDVTRYLDGIDEAATRVPGLVAQLARHAKPSTP